jgi:hypothetical protein
MKTEEKERLEMNTGSTEGQPQPNRDILLLDVKSLVNAQLREIDKNNTKNICKQFLMFVFNKGLLKKNPFDIKGEFITIDFQVKESDLVKIEPKVFYNLLLKWLAYTDKTNKVDNVAMLDKWYSKMIKE